MWIQIYIILRSLIHPQKHVFLTSKLVNHTSFSTICDDCIGMMWRCSSAFCTEGGALVLVFWWKPNVRRQHTVQLYKCCLCTLFAWPYSCELRALWMHCVCVSLLVLNHQYSQHAVLPVLVAVVGTIPGDSAQLFAIATQCLGWELILWGKKNTKKWLYLMLSWQSHYYNKTNIKVS